MTERDIPGKNPFEDPEYVREFVRLHELRKQAEESLQQSLLKQAEINFRDNIHPNARKARRTLAQRKHEQKREQEKLIKESNTRALGEPDYLDRMHSMMNSHHSGKRDRLFDAERRHYSKRKRPGWGTWGHLTRAQAAQRMHDWIDQTSGAVLPSTREEHWEQLMFDEEILRSAG